MKSSILEKSIFISFVFDDSLPFARELMLHPDSVIGHAALGYRKISVIDEAHCIAFRFYGHRIPGGAYAVVVI